MKQTQALSAALALPIVLGLAGAGSPPAFAERDDATTTPTKRVDTKTRLMEASLERSTYGIEGKDWGIAETTEVRAGKLHAHTPRFHALASTITTKELHEQIIGAEPPVLVDVLGGKGHRSVPSAVWLKGAGLDDDREEDVDTRLNAKLDELTGDDKSRGIVFFCLSAECWLSYNAALRAVRLGYENVHWYRGGINAWKKAKLPTVKVRKTRW